MTGTVPTPMIPSRVLVALSVTLAVLLLLAGVVSLAIWHTPALHPVDVPSVRQT